MKRIGDSVESAFMAGGADRLIDESADYLAAHDYGETLRSGEPFEVRPTRALARAVLMRCWEDLYFTGSVPGGKLTPADRLRHNARARAQIQADARAWLMDDSREVHSFRWWWTFALGGSATQIDAVRAEMLARKPPQERKVLVSRDGSINGQCKQRRRRHAQAA